MCDMNQTGDQMDGLEERVDALEAKVDAIAEHLNIILSYSPETYKAVTKQELEKALKAGTPIPMK